MPELDHLLREAQRRLRSGVEPDTVRRWLIESAVEGLLTAEDAAARLGIAPRTLRQLATSRGAGIRIGEGKRAVLLLTEADIDALRDRKVGRPRKAVPERTEAG